MKPPILLRIYRDDRLEGVRQFEAQQVVIGQNPDTQLVLADESVSPLHALIEERESGYYLSDLGSATGTIRNGTRILDEKIESGDELRIGPFRIQFFVGVPKPVGPPGKTAPGSGAPTPPILGKPLAPTPTAAPTPTPKSGPPPKSAAPTPPSRPAIPDEVPPAVPSAPVAEPKAKPEPKAKLEPKSESKPEPKSESKSTKSESQTRPELPKSAPGRMAPVKKEPKRTFAPPSTVQDARQIVKPGKGTVIEVIVAWKERIIAARHFNERCEVTVGGDPSCDVVVPVMGLSSKFPLVRIDSFASIRLTSDMQGEVIRESGTVTFQELAKQNRLRPAASGFEFDLPQGEMVRIALQGNLISIFVRYVQETPKPVAAPVLDLTASEVTGVILSVVVALIFGLYMYIYSPKELVDEAMLEEPIRKAIVTFRPPEKKVIEPAPEVPKEEKKVVQIVEKQKQAQSPSPESKDKPGKAAEVAPKETKDKKKEVTSVRQGGAIKTAPKEGSTPQAAKPDPTKFGLLSVFGSKGTQEKLDKTFKGAGDLTGLANEATGFAGNADTRAGSQMGTKLRDTGAGGKGTATVGIAGVGTKGKGTGSYGLGTGGIGTKGSVDIDIGGQEAEFSGTIDREAIRRKIQENRRAIRNCYERALQRKPDLYGKLVVEWDIEERGKVTKAVVKSSTVGDNSVSQCVVNVIRQITFPEPPPDQIGRVSYPFLFSSQ